VTRLFKSLPLVPVSLLLASYSCGPKDTALSDAEANVVKQMSDLSWLTPMQEALRGEILSSSRKVHHLPLNVGDLERSNGKGFKYLMLVSGGKMKEVRVSFSEMALKFVEVEYSQKYRKHYALYILKFRQSDWDFGVEIDKNLAQKHKPWKLVR
jgi:hypothetical protein